MKIKRNAGVTLIESLIVIAAVAVFIGVLVIYGGRVAHQNRLGIGNFERPKIGVVYNVMAVDLTSGIVVVKPFTSDPKDSERRFVFKQVSERVQKQGVWFIRDNNENDNLIDPPPVEAGVSKDKPIDHEPLQ